VLESTRTGLCTFLPANRLLTVKRRPHVETAEVSQNGERRRDETVVVNAAAGGVGSLAVQLAKHLGAGRVIATASTDAKRDLALSLGADVAVSSDADGYAERVLGANDGMPVDVVLESIGGRVFSAGLDILANFGNASREGRPPVDPGALADRNNAVMGL
jgi:NADPH2:quinone reductase